MKYLKLFEENVEYYKEIMYSEYLDYFSEERKSELLNFTTAERHGIYNLLDDNDDRFIKSASTYKQDPRTIVIQFSSGYNILIWKLKDDWYLVHPSGFGEIQLFGGEDYKCDQWDGLLMCLKNEFKIK